MDRRNFMQCCGGIAGLSLPGKQTSENPVSTLGLGTADLYRLPENDSVALLQKAYSHGITFFDTAAAYGNGLSETRLGKVLKPVRDIIFISSKTLARDKKNAQYDLQASLKRLQTNYLDLWMIHDLRTKQEWKELSRKGGALSAFQSAKENGTVKSTGLSANRNPELVLHVIQSIPLDFLMIPVTPEDSPFVHTILPEAVQRGIKVLAIRVLGLPKKKTRNDREVSNAIYTALTLPISCAVTGCENTDQLQTTIKAAKTYL